MRLLNVHTLEFSHFHGDVPIYIIASHRWKAGTEVMIEDVENRRNTKKSGYEKIEGFARYIKKHVPEVQWLWIDTCCVNQSSSVEVDEAVNTMFRWYSNADACLAYLADVHSADDQVEFEASEWFHRGWTLQELLAPYVVVFLSQTWDVIGHKGGSGCTRSGFNVSTGPSLEAQIASITGIPECVLNNYDQSNKFSTEERLTWMACRETTRDEDTTYSLLGVFGIRMRLSYGEGSESARRRLLVKVAKATEREDSLTKTMRWLAPPDPWVNHALARKYYEAETGVWMLQSSQYLKWKTGPSAHLWLYGSAGCGKTILCSTIVDDVRLHCETTRNAGLAIFYFSFSDSQKQTTDSLLRSLVAQLGHREPATSMLLQAYNKPDRSLPRTDELEKIVLTALTAYDEVFLVFDALDECPETDEIRQNVLEQLERLSKRSTNCKMLVTSREVRDIRESMGRLGAEPTSIVPGFVDGDIRKHIARQLSCDPRLHRLDSSMKALIESHLSQSADGMFRWVYCQLQELKKLKSTRPSHIRSVLRALPRTLDETYERMLTELDSGIRGEALVLLQWLAYARSPPTQGQLLEASIIDPTGDGSVDINDRGGLEDSLSILCGLVTVVKATDDHDEDDSNNADCISTNLQSSDARGIPWRKSGTIVKLAHFSVKEFLESDRILRSDAKGFHLKSTRSHGFLAQSCLCYIMHYSNSSGKTLTTRDIETFPLIGYAARSWYHHSTMQEVEDSSRECSLLASENTKLDWLKVHQPDQRSAALFRPAREIGSSVYYGSLLGLRKAVQRLIGSGASIHTEGGYYGNALQAASSRGHQAVARLLLEHGASVAAKGGRHGTALRAAIVEGHKTVVRLLLENGADIHAQGRDYRPPLHIASVRGDPALIFRHKVDATEQRSMSLLEEATRLWRDFC
ncbi:hypothetical protein LTR81_000570 [Elasticomyces elasticus]